MQGPLLRGYWNRRFTSTSTLYASTGRRFADTDAAFVAETVNSGMVKMAFTQTMDMVADIGTKRFMDPSMWLKALYLINIVSPRFWTAKSLPAYYQHQYDDGIP